MIMGDVAVYVYLYCSKVFHLEFSVVYSYYFSCTLVFFLILLFRFFFINVGKLTLSIFFSFVDDSTWLKCTEKILLKISFYASMKLLGDLVSLAFLSPNLKIGKGIP